MSVGLQFKGRLVRCWERHRFHSRQQAFGGLKHPVHSWIVSGNLEDPAGNIGLGKETEAGRLSVARRSSGGVVRKMLRLIILTLKEL